MCKILCVQTPDVIMMFLVWFPIPEKPFHIFIFNLDWEGDAYETFIVSQM